MEANRKVVMGVLLAGAFVIILNQTLLNTALPAFMRDFGVTANTAQWVTTTFMLVNGIMIPTTAFLIQRFTTRTMYMMALGSFTIGTIICAIAPVFGVLILGRVIQAIGGGIIMPLMQTILFAIYSVKERGAAMGTFGLIISFAPAIGPTLSGWIVDHLPWQTLFLMMLPIAVIVMVVAHLILANVTETTHPRLDIPSIILSTLAFGGLLYGLSSSGNVGWANPQVWGPLLIGVVTLVIFIRRQLRIDQPLLQFRIMKSPMFTLNTALGMCVFMVMMGGMLVLPLFIQNMQGHTAMQAGMVLLPGAIIMGFSSPVTGRLFDRFGARWLAVIGFSVLTVTTLMFTRMTLDTSLWYIAGINALRMLGTAMVMMPVTTAALNQLPQRLIPHGSAVNNTLRQVAASVGSATLVTVMTMTARDPAVFGPEGPVHGVNMAFLVSGLLGVVGIVGSFLIRNSFGPVDRHDEAGT